MIPEPLDFVIAGSGFSGSITAMCLHQCGFRVCLLEQKSHPRFAIGESSTPIADMILRRLSDEYDLPFLKTLSRYGSWLEHHPDLVCGAKRGFAYFFHHSGTPYREDSKRFNPLLVAASRHLEDSDTHWYRAHIDNYLVSKARDLGIPVFEQTTIVRYREMTGDPETDPKSVLFSLDADRNGEPVHLSCRWLIDATGSSTLANRFFGINASSDSFLCNTTAIYSHYDGSGEWERYLQKQGIEISEYPFSPDHAALHHMIEQGWIWNLRFRDGRLSAGLMIDGKTHGDILQRLESDDKIWNEIISQYPSLHTLFSTASLAPLPGFLIRSNRLQRKLPTVWKRGWIALNHTAGFVDPLHSTGIAHSLTGIERLLHIFKTGLNRPGRLHDLLDNHEATLFQEFSLIDKMVAHAYLCRRDPDLFHVAAMIYFTATVAYEQHRLRGDMPDSYLLANDQAVNRMADESFGELSDINKTLSKQDWSERVKKRITPWNSAGLLNLSGRGLYRHTAVELNANNQN